MRPEIIGLSDRIMHTHIIALNNNFKVTCRECGEHLNDEDAVVYLERLLGSFYGLTYWRMIRRKRDKLDAWKRGSNEGETIEFEGGYWVPSENDIQFF